MNACQRFALPLLIGAFAALTAGATDFVPARAVVTTVTGSCAFHSGEGKRSRPGLHDVLEPAGSTLTTPVDGRIALALSNGLGLAVHARTEVEFTRASQTPFDDATDSLGTEPSVSGIHLRLAEGVVALAHPEPSALSEIHVTTPTGTFRFHRGRAIVAVDVAGARVFIEEGAGTFVFPDGAGRELMAGGSALLVTPYSASRGTATRRDAAVPASPAWGGLADTARRSRDRVLHLAAAEDGRAGFVLLNREEEPDPLPPTDQPEEEAQ